MNYEIELDIAHSIPLKHTLKTICNKFKVRVVNIMPNGPGGGWPCVLFHGTEENITSLALDYHQQTEVDEFIKEQITKL